MTQHRTHRVLSLSWLWKAAGLAGLLVALSAQLVSAAGVDLAWNQCRGQRGAAMSKTSACLSTSGSQCMFASFSPPAGVQALEGCEVYIEYQESGGALSCWWTFSVGTTRNDALTVLPLPPTAPETRHPPIVSSRPTLPWIREPTIACGPYPFVPSEEGYYFLAHAGVAASGGGWIRTGGNTAQFKSIVVLRQGTGGPVTPEVQQYALGVCIDNTNTGAGCAGCLDGVVLVLTRIVLVQPGAPNIDLTTPVLGNAVLWNAGFPGSTATRTWGGVKALFHN
jgi:hypothetical protein